MHGTPRPRLTLPATRACTVLCFAESPPSAPRATRPHSRTCPSTSSSTPITFGCVCHDPCRDTASLCRVRCTRPQVRLDLLKEMMDAKGGFVPLPTILNGKTVDPQIDASTKVGCVHSTSFICACVCVYSLTTACRLCRTVSQVWQLETAMGAAIECFSGAAAVCVSRDRFAPVKKCSDLLLLRSDAYVVHPQSSVLLLSPQAAAAPIVALDDKVFKLVQNLEACVRDGYPSLLRCQRLSVSGCVHLSSRHVFEGSVSHCKHLPALPTPWLH